MTSTDPIQKAPPPKPLAPRVPDPTQQTKADTLRRLSIWKNGVAVASVAGFLAITGAIVDQHSGTTSAAPAVNVAQVAPVLIGSAAATATPPSTATALQADPATASSPPHLGKAATTGPRAAKQAAVVVATATAIPAPAATSAATATADATATLAATVTPAATATTLPTATPATQNGGYSLGNSSTAQQPVAATTVS